MKSFEVCPISGGQFKPGAIQLREHSQTALVPQSQANANAFVPITLDEAAPDIRVEVQRTNATIVVKWPLQGSAACAAWLREWLR